MTNHDPPVPPDEGVSPMKRRMMTDAEREEIAEIERKAKQQFEEAGERLFGLGFKQRTPRLYRD